MRGTGPRLLAVVGLLALLAACADDEDPATPSTLEATMTMTVSSPEFADGATIPQRFTCEGEDI
jgi:hypothetical protein